MDPESEKDQKESKDPKKCDICLQDQDPKKCNDCTFVSCNDCIINWYMCQGKKSCPMCKSIESYDVDHSEVVVNNEDPEDNTFAIENVNIALVMEQIAREAGMTDQE